MSTLQNRSNRWLAPLLTAAAMMLSVVPIADAQQNSASPRGQDPSAVTDKPAIEDAPVAQLVAALDKYALVQAQQALALDDDNYPQFVARLRRLQDTRRRYQRHRDQLVRELNKMSLPTAPQPVDDGLLRARLQALRDLDARSAAELVDAYALLDEILTPRQQARFRVFEQQIERRKLDLLLRAKNANRADRKAIR